MDPIKQAASSSVPNLTQTATESIINAFPSNAPMSSNQVQSQPQTQPQTPRTYYSPVPGWRPSDPTARVIYITPNPNSPGGSDMTPEGQLTGLTYNLNNVTLPRTYPGTNIPINVQATNSSGMSVGSYIANQLQNIPAQINQSQTVSPPQSNYSSSSSLAANSAYQNLIKAVNNNQNQILGGGMGIASPKNPFYVNLPSSYPNQNPPVQPQPLAINKADTSISGRASMFAKTATTGFGASTLPQLTNEATKEVGNILKLAGNVGAVASKIPFSVNVPIAGFNSGGVFNSNLGLNYQTPYSIGKIADVINQNMNILTTPLSQGTYNEFAGSQPYSASNPISYLGGVAKGVSTYFSPNFQGQLLKEGQAAQTINSPGFQAALTNRGGLIGQYNLLTGSQDRIVQNQQQLNSQYSSGNINYFDYKTNFDSLQKQYNLLGSQEKDLNSQIKNIETSPDYKNIVNIFGADKYGNIIPPTTISAQMEKSSQKVFGLPASTVAKTFFSTVQGVSYATPLKYLTLPAMGVQGVQNIQKGNIGEGLIETGFASTLAAGPVVNYLGEVSPAFNNLFSSKAVQIGSKVGSAALATTFGVSQGLNEFQASGSIPSALGVSGGTVAGLLIGSTAERIGAARAARAARAENLNSIFQNKGTTQISIAPETEQQIKEFASRDLQESAGTSLLGQEQRISRVYGVQVKDPIGNIHKFVYVEIGKAAGGSDLTGSRSYLGYELGPKILNPGTGQMEQTYTNRISANSVEEIKNGLTGLQTNGVIESMKNVNSLTASFFGTSKPATNINLNEISRNTGSISTDIGNKASFSWLGNVEGNQIEAKFGEIPTNTITTKGESIAKVSSASPIKIKPGEFAGYLFPEKEGASVESVRFTKNFNNEFIETKTPYQPSMGPGEFLRLGEMSYTLKPSDFISIGGNEKLNNPWFKTRVTLPNFNFNDLNPISNANNIPSRLQLPTGSRFNLFSEMNIENIGKNYPNIGLSPFSASVNDIYFKPLSTETAPESQSLGLITKSENLRIFNPKEVKVSPTSPFVQVKGEEIGLGRGSPEFLLNYEKFTKTGGKIVGFEKPTEESSNQVLVSKEQLGEQINKAVLKEAQEQAQRSLGGATIEALSKYASVPSLADPFHILTAAPTSAIKTTQINQQILTPSLNSLQILGPKQIQTNVITPSNVVTTSTALSPLLSPVEMQTQTQIQELNTFQVQRQGQQQQQLQNTGLFFMPPAETKTTDLTGKRKWIRKKLTLKRRVSPGYDVFIRRGRGRQQMFIPIGSRPSIEEASYLGFAGVKRSLASTFEIKRNNHLVKPILVSRELRPIKKNPFFLTQKSTKTFGAGSRLSTPQEIFQIQAAKKSAAQNKRNSFVKSNKRIKFF